MQIFRNLFNPQRSIYPAALYLSILTFLPALAAIQVVDRITKLVDYNPAPPSINLTGLGLIVVTVLGPFFETLLLAVGIWLISRFTKSANFISAISAVIWGVLHSLNSPLWGLGIVWPFFVFSRAYIAWRPTGKSNAIGVAWLTHALHNSFGTGLLLLTT